MGSGNDMKWSQKAWLELVAIGVGVVVSGPLYLLLINSFKSHAEILRTPVAFPGMSVGFDNVYRAVSAMNIGRAYGTSALIGFVSVLIAISVSAVAGYAVSRLEHPLFRFMYWVFLAGILLPIPSLIIPLVFVLKSLGLGNTLIGISLAYAAVISPFAIFVYSGFFRTIPRELEEAAFIDGCSPVRVFFQIALPLMRPVTATLTILQFIYVWSDILFPLVLVSSNDLPTVGIALWKFFGSRGQTDLSLLFGGSILVLVPVLVLFFSFQRYFVKGLVAGALKG